MNKPQRKRRHLSQGEIKPEGIPIRSAEDHEILMHRETHFGGSFAIMLEYYHRGGRGINPDFELKTIKMLALLEKEMNQNLAAMLLTGPEAEKVAEAKKIYKQLRDLYEDKALENQIPLHIADLILTEDEKAEKEIATVVEQKAKIVPALIEVMHAENLYDPLFPGYGHAPFLAAKCLGLIGDKRSIISLFETIREEEFFNEDTILEALKHIGEPAKQFLLKIVQGRPVTMDTERAAIALIQFKEDTEVADTCFDMLQNPEVLSNELLATYLVLACEGLTSSEKRSQFRAMADDPKNPKTLRNDINMISKSWDSS